MRHLHFLRRVAALLVLTGTFAVSDAGPAFAVVTPTMGTIVVQADFYAPGLTTSLPAAVPDPTQWQTWPGRGWRLAANVYPSYTGTCLAYRTNSTTNDYYIHTPTTCGFSVSGSMRGWCDISKGIGGGGYGSYPQPDWGTITSFRWSGAGATLAVTGEMTSYVWSSIEATLTGGDGGGTAVGTFAGTMTFLQGSGTPFDPCQSPNGVQPSIPVLLELTYALS